MKIKEVYPAMSKANQGLIKNMLWANFEYILEAGEDEVCQFILDEGMATDAFPHVAKRVAEFSSGTRK